MKKTTTIRINTKVKEKLDKIKEKYSSNSYSDLINLMIEKTSKIELLEKLIKELEKKEN